MPGANSLEGSALADSDLIVINFNVSGNAQNVISDLKYLNTQGYNVSVSTGADGINVSSDAGSIYEVLYILEYENNQTPVNINSVTFTLSEAAKNSAAGEADADAVKNTNLTGVKDIKNKNLTVVPNTSILENATGYSAQQQEIFNMLYDDAYMKTKVVSVVEI